MVRIMTQDKIDETISLLHEPRFIVQQLLQVKDIKLHFRLTANQNYKNHSTYLVKEVDAEVD